MENYFLLEIYITSEGVVSHNVLYYQHLPITRYQVSFSAKKYFEELPIVSTAFNWDLFREGGKITYEEYIVTTWNLLDYF